jgi:DNA polymerase III epsilon subunit-like protein
MAIEFYVCDLECTGLRKGFHEICEFSILKAADRTQLTRSVRVDYPENASYDALLIIKKSMSDLKSGISKRQMIEEIEGFVSDDNLTSASRCLVGHNIIGFDKKFLWHEWEKVGKQFPFDLYLDTLHMSRAYVKKQKILDKPKLNLGAACDLLGIKKVAGQHAARADVRNTYLLWDKLMKEVDYLDYISRMPHYDDKDNGNEY